MTTPDWPDTPIGELVTQVRRPVAVNPDTEYPLLGVRWYAEGPFHRETVSGSSTKTKQFFQVREGDFIYNRLFAWKGSFGVIPTELDGYFVSGEFPLFITNPSLILPEYLFLAMSRPTLWSQIERESTGSTSVSRNRWKEERFLEHKVPLPVLEDQRAVVCLVNSFATAIKASRAEINSITDALAAARRELIPWGKNLRPLGEIATIEAKLVDPTEADYSALPHIGIERIEARTGNLLPLVSASEDGVFSANFAFSADDIIYSKIRPELRKAAYPRFAGLCSADAYPLRCRPTIYPGYLLEVLLSDEFAEQAIAKSGRTKMPKVNRSELFSIPVPVPALPAQEAIVGLLEDLRRSLSATSALVDAAIRARLCLIEDAVIARRPLSAREVVLT